MGVSIVIKKQIRFFRIYLVILVFIVYCCLNMCFSKINTRGPKTALITPTPSLPSTTMNTPLSQVVPPTIGLTTPTMKYCNNF